MTDKQIIINNVDVSRCDFLAKEDDYCSYSGEYRAYKGQCGCSDEEMCKDHPNCFYKKALNQLKCKEQECEELKKQVKKYGEINEQETKDYAELKAENDLFRTCHDNEQEKRRKYEQTLIEIKEIAEEVYNDCDNCYRDVDTNSDIDCIDCTLGGKAKLAKQILQKISESEVTNAR